MRLFLTAALAALLALPAWAQTPATPTPAARPAASRAAAPAAPPAKVDINTGSERQLEALTGIGPVRAKAIIGGRPYEELQDLVKKKVLTQGVLDTAKPGMALANINTSTAAQMVKTLPGIGEVRSAAIVAARPYAAPHDLVAKGVLTEDAFAKIKDLVSY